MARQKTIEISGLNIVTQPHTPESYLKLFELLSSARMPIQVRGDEYLMLLNVRAIMGDEKLNGIEGEVLKFTNIDNAGDWYDILKGTKLKDSEVPKIPANAQPNGVMFHYVFHPKKHIFYFISKSRDSIKNKVESLSPNYMKTLFETGFAHINKSKKLNFDSIEITVLPSNDALNSIIKIPVLKKLEIVVKAPNPDDISTAAAAMLARMNMSYAEETVQLNLVN